MKNTAAITAVIIGNEILAGRRKDAHLANTIAACNARGLRLDGAVFLSDSIDAIISTFSRLLSAGHTVLSFGGIGATPDDRTRQAAAKTSSRPLVYHPEGLKILQSRFTGDELTENRKNLIAFPEGASLIPNPVNQIPGFSIGRLHCVPGFPQMAEPMIAWVLDTYCIALRQERSYRALIVHAPESEIAPLMTELEARYPNTSISSLPQISRSTELGAEGSPEEAEAAIASAARWLAARGFDSAPLI